TLIIQTGSSSYLLQSAAIYLCGGFLRQLVCFQPALHPFFAFNCPRDNYPGRVLYAPGTPGFSHSAVSFGPPAAGGPEASCSPSRFPYCAIPWRPDYLLLSSHWAAC